MKGIRRLLVAAVGAGALVLSLLPAQAQAAENAVVVFTAGATVTKPVFLPGVGPGADNVGFTFDTMTYGLNGTVKACVGAHSVNGVDAECRLRSEGEFGKGLGGLGAYCGWSSGDGFVKFSDINGDVLPAAGLSVEWPNSAGTVIPLVYRLRNQAKTIVGAGAVQTTGAKPTTCGLEDPTRGTTTFAVTGWSAFSA